jgi:hypothetical protein
MKAGSNPKESPMSKITASNEIIASILKVHPKWEKVHPRWEQDDVPLDVEKREAGVAD